METVDEVKVERAELGGSHGTTSEESKKSFQMNEERIQRVGGRGVSESQTQQRREVTDGSGVDGGRALGSY